MKLPLREIERLRLLFERGGRRRLLLIGVPVLLVLALAVPRFLGHGTSAVTPTAKVQRGDVRITLTECPRCPTEGKSTSG